MNASTDQPANALPRRQVLAEVVLIFAVFFIQGAVPVPDVNEPYYLGKAIHYWNPGWASGDFFFESADTHSVFYFTFGWLSRWLAPAPLAWTGRLLTWALLAWAWRRLSFAVVPRPWFSVLTAALTVCLVERCHMAGEWFLGGVEAKGFAYVLVFLGLEAVVRNRFNRAWLLLGAAAALHVLVGGWAVVAAGVAWFSAAKARPSLRSMAPALLGGFVLSLPGLLPSLVLNWGTDGNVVRAAHQIYVYERLAHHLWIGRIPGLYIGRFALLLIVWGVLCALVRADEPSRRLRDFVRGTLLLLLAGVALSAVALLDRPLGAGLLRFYWFRLADVAVPMGVALGAASLIVSLRQSRPMAARICLTAAVVAAAVHVGVHAVERTIPRPSPADRLPDYVAWRDACNWVGQSGEIPRQARFLTPRMAQTFKWYTGRAEVAVWKEIPQDANAIVEWRRRLDELYSAGSAAPSQRPYRSLAEHDTETLCRLGRNYEADYAITFARPRLPLEVVYENRTYAIYRLPSSSLRAPRGDVPRGS